MANGNLPPGWVWTTVKDVVSVLETGGRPKGGAKGITSGVPSLGGEHLLYSGGFDFENIRYVPEEYFQNMKKGRIKKNDVLVVKDGATTGKTSFVDDNFPFPQAAVNEHVFILRTLSISLPKFLFYWFQSPNGQECIKDNFQGTAQGGITSRFVENSTFPLPPLPEQERIVERIESLFTRLDAGVAALKRARAALRRYKASLLKAACEGRLVPQDPQDEPAEELLRRLGKKPLEGDGLGELPKGWCWGILEELSSNANYGTSTKCDYAENEYPVIRIPNIISGNVDTGDLKFAVDGSGLRDKDSLSPGDLIIIRTNGSKDLIGRCAFIHKPLHRKLYFASYLIRYKIINFEIIGTWIVTIWDSLLIRAYLENVISTTAGQYNLNIVKLNKVPIPLPPLNEQMRIVAEVERRLSLVQELEQTIEPSLKRAARLRQAILKRAFEGRLV
ncbi:MAG: restriction endonuclease subunit S [Anaerolineales bacterium]|nr:restriction endonuclease subunit S [Anaerolineales bacterium]